MTLRTLVVIALFVVSHCFTSELYYIADQPLNTKPKQLIELEHNHYNLQVIYIDCIQSPLKCQRLKAKKEGFPQLVLWAGPGRAYKHLGTANKANLDKYFQTQNVHPLKQLRSFVQNLSQLQCGVLTFLLILLLTSMFSFLFTNRLKNHVNSNKEKNA